MKSIFFLLLCFGWLQAVAIPHSYYHCKQISIEHGLPTSITSLCRDSENSLWIGTKLGIYRMKGEKLEKYELPYQLRQRTHYIVRICRGPEQRIWVATLQGLCYYDAQADSLKVLTCRGELVKSDMILSDGRQVVIPQRDGLLVYDGQMRFSHSIALDMGGSP